MILDNLSFDAATIIEICIAAGIAYGVLRVKTQSTALRLDELEKEGLALDLAMQARVTALQVELQHHKQDTTDRLARIETKLDILLQQR
jgi:hypothetical protein